MLRVVSPTSIPERISAVGRLTGLEQSITVHSRYTRKYSVKASH